MLLTSFGVGNLAAQLIPNPMVWRQLNRLLPAPLLTGALNSRESMIGVDLQTIARRLQVAGMAISKRVPTFMLKRKGHSCQKSVTTKNDRAFTV